MQGSGMILPHHVVAEVDERKSNEFRNIENLDIAEAGEASADAGEKRPDRNQNVAEEAGPALVLGEILDGRVNGAAEQKHEGIEVEERRKGPDPLPCEHAPGEAVIEALWNLDRRGQYAD